MSTSNKNSFGAESIHWNLSALFVDMDLSKLSNYLKKSLNDAIQFENKFKTKLDNLSTQDLIYAYQEMEQLLTPYYELSQYVHLRYAIETDNDVIKSWVAKVEEQGADISNHLLFFDLEIALFSKDLQDQHLSNEGIGDYYYPIKNIFDTANYNLTQKEEQLINKKDLTGEDAFKKLYEELTSSYEFKFELDGDVQLLNGSQLRNLRLHPDPDVRRRSMATFFKQYDKDSLVLTHIFNNILKSYSIESKMRGYTSAIQVRNTGNDLSDKAIQVLHDVTTESNTMVQRYYCLKRKILGLHELTLADIYAPMPSADKEYSYDEAKDIVLSSFKQFDEDFYLKAKLMFDENRIHAPVMPRKRGGAFCSGSTPRVKPYVMLNFMGKARDVATMAHELGHAIHDMYCSKQTLTNYHPILPLAETASVFSEMIVTDNLLKHETSSLVKQSILTDKLEDLFATSHRQNMFSRFEMRTHETIAQSIMSSQELCDVYEEELISVFGDSVTILPEYRWEWSTIPHIYEWPFYVYAYNFGNLLVMSLYQSYRDIGSDFVPKFKDLLSSGSVDSPKKLVSNLGADIEDINFWKQSLTLIESMLDQLEELLEKG